MAFCIPNTHYKWTVLPFRLKVAPSPFQKAMTRVFESLLGSALIYIYDLLLFLPNEDYHRQLLEKFYETCDKYGVMLSSRKSQIGNTKVDFLGIHFTRGKYVPQPHIVEELPKFPDENMSTEQI